MDKASAASTARLALFGVLYSTGSTYLLQIAGLVAGVALARLVDPAEFGLLALAITIFEIIGRVRLFGLNQILISKPEPDAADTSTHFFLTVGLSAATFGLTLLAAPLLGQFYPSKLITALLVVAALALFDQEGLTATPDTLLRKNMRYGQIARLDIAAGLFSMVAAVSAAVAGWGVWALIVRQGVETLTRCVGTWWLCGWRPAAWPTWSKAKTLLRSGAHMWVGGVSSLIGYRYDDFLVGTLLGTRILGFYTRAFDYAKLPMGPLAGIYAVSLPAFARLQNDRRLLSRAYNLFLEAVALFAFPASIWLAIVAPEFVEGVIGPKWEPMIPLVRLLIPFALLRPILDGTGGIPIVLGRPDVRSKQAILESAVMLSAGTILILRFGAIGAAISAGLVVSVTLGGLYFWYVKDSLDVEWRRIFLVPILSIIAASGLTYWVGLQVTDWPALGRLAIKTGAFGITFAVLILLLHRAALVELFALLTDTWRGSSKAQVPDGLP